jgi:hypothetical protein
MTAADRESIDRSLVRRRCRQTRTDVNRQVIEDRRRLRAFHAFRADARQDITVGWRLRGGDDETRQRKDGNPVHSCHVNSGLLNRNVIVTTLAASESVHIETITLEHRGG